MRILVISRGFPPVCHSGTFRVTAFAEHAVTLGHKVMVVTGTCPDWVIQYGDHHPAPSGVTVIRVPFNVEPPQGTLSRRVIQGLARRLGIRTSIDRWLLRRVCAKSVCNEALCYVREFSPEVVLSSSPPESCHVIAKRLATALAIPYVCDLRDPWSYRALVSYHSRLDFYLERELERRTLSSAAAVVANTPTAARLLLRYVGLSSSLVHVIPNGYSLPELQEVQETIAVNRAADEFWIVYTGFLYRPSSKPLVGFKPVHDTPEFRSLLPLLRGIQVLRARAPEIADRIRIVCAGNDPFEGLPPEFASDTFFQVRIRHVGCLPPNKALHYALAADCLLLTQIGMKVDGRVMCTAIPGKLYSYLATGKPILACMEESDATNLVRRLAAGEVCHPSDAGGIAEAVIRIYNKTKNRYSPTDGKCIDHHDILQKFERREIAKNLIAILECASGTRRDVTDYTPYFAPLPH